MTRFAGHCYISKDEVVSDLIMWTPKHGKAKVERQVRPTLYN